MHAPIWFTCRPWRFSISYRSPGQSQTSKSRKALHTKVRSILGHPYEEHHAPQSIDIGCCSGDILDVQSRFDVIEYLTQNCSLSRSISGEYEGDSSQLSCISVQARQYIGCDHLSMACNDVDTHQYALLWTKQKADPTT